MVNAAIMCDEISGLLRIRERKYLLLNSCGFPTFMRYTFIDVTSKYSTVTDSVGLYLELLYLS